MKNEAIVISASDYGLEEKKGKEITKGLSTILQERDILSKLYLDIIKLELTEENLPRFKELRLKIVKNRTQGISDWHTKNKAFYLAGGRFVDAIKNKEIVENERMESTLLDAEKHFENIEKKRIEDLEKTRVELLKPYYAEAEMLNLGVMEQDVFDSYLSTKKKAFEDNVTANKLIEAERSAKEKAEAEEQERVRLENEKLKKEIANTERLAEAEAARLKKEQESEDARKAEAEKARKIEADRIQAENDAKLKAEQEEKQRIQNELQAKKDAEIKAESDRLATVEAELNKGDSAKVLDLISDLETLKTKYEFKSVKNKKMYSDTILLIDKVVTFIK